jgi:hypothetical protein
MINREYIASELYRVYCEAVGGKAFNGDPLPDWETFYADETKKKQSNAWLAAADRAIQLLVPEEDNSEAFSDMLYAFERVIASGQGELMGYLAPMPCEDIRECSRLKEPIWIEFNEPEELTVDGTSDMLKDLLDRAKATYGIIHEVKFLKLPLDRDKNPDDKLWALRGQVYGKKGEHPLKPRDVLEFDSSFAGALNYLKDGFPMQRSGWNGKNMFVYMVPANSYPAQTGVAKAHFGEGAMVPYGAYLALKGADGTVNTWVPSIADLMAEDWSPVDLTALGGHINEETAKQFRSSLAEIRPDLGYVISQKKMNNPE